MHLERLRKKRDDVKKRTHTANVEAKLEEAFKNKKIKIANSCSFFFIFICEKNAIFKRTS